MKTPQSNTSIREKIEEILSPHIMNNDECFECNVNFREAKAAIESLIHQEVREARVDPFDFVEPCEENCTPERHAYHQGQWDMAGRINKHFGLAPFPGEALEAQRENV